MGSEIFSVSDFFWTVIQKPLGIYQLLISMELYKIFYKDVSIKKVLWERVKQETLTRKKIIDTDYLYPYSV